MARGPLLSAADVAQCPHRVALERGAPDGFVTAPMTVEIARRVRDGALHREAIFVQLRERYPEAVTARSYDATLTALGDGALVIFEARLIDDGPARRSTVVDLLVRVNNDEAPRYVPVIIKRNEILENAPTRRLLEGDLDHLRPNEAHWTGGVGTRRNDVMARNGLALDHATRLLESVGYGDPAHFGGLIDKQARLWWFDLDSEEWGRWRLQSYDEAYEQRRQILMAHDQWRAGVSPFPTVAFWHRDCVTCPFAGLCEPELQARDDVSLVRFTSLEQQLLLREHGVATRTELATLDPQLARVARSRAALANVELTRESHLGRSIDKLDDLIYRARAAVAGTPLRIGPADEIHCRTAQVEVDIDMESYGETTYLWGAYVSCREPVAGIEEGYVAFVRWTLPDGTEEAELFGEFWTWFRSLRERATAAAVTFAAYCFWAHAEDGAMNRAAHLSHDDGHLAAQLHQFRHREPAEWIDLHFVAKQQIQTDGPLGLKVLARGAGFEWRDENPSGEASMVWYEEATGDDPLLAGLARERLLLYNEDDCRATRALREWLNSGARHLASRDEVPPGAALDSR